MTITLLHCLVFFQDSFDEQLNTEKKHLLDLNKQILKTTNEIYHAKRQAIRSTERKGRKQYSEKSIGNLQNKLYAVSIHVSGVSYNTLNGRITDIVFII